MRMDRLFLLCLAALVGLATSAARADDSSATSAPTTSKPAKSDKAGDASSSSDEEEKAKTTNKIPTLEDRIKPVSGAIFEGGGRHELSPEFDLSLDDPFFQKYMFGLKYAYHINNQFAVGLRGVFGFATPSSSVNICNSLTCGAPTLQQLLMTPGDIGLMIGLNLDWAPLYGKMNFFGERVLHFDTFVSAGPDVIQYHDPSAAGNAAFTFGGHVGVGQHYLFNQWFGIRVDFRDYFYAGNRDVNGVAQGGLENQLMLEIGASFFFPLHPKSDS
jgi:outer membrane beta-barrel protein